MVELQGIILSNISGVGWGGGWGGGGGGGGVAGGLLYLRLPEDKIFQNLSSLFKFQND